MALRMPLWAPGLENTRYRPFELYYFDDTADLLVLSLCIGMTSGRIDSVSPNGVVLNRTMGTVAIAASEEVDIVPCPFARLSSELTAEDADEKSNQIDCSDIRIVIVGRPYPITGRLPDSAVQQQGSSDARQGKYGLRLC